MKIFGKSLSEYLIFEKWFLVLILVVGLTRLVLSLFGVPASIDKFFSLTVLFLLGMVFYSITVHKSGFGSYKQLLPVIALPVILGSAIIVGGIVLAILTNRDNIFSTPEFSPGRVDGKTWVHAGSHCVAAIIISLVLWGLGCLLMLATKKLAGGETKRPA